MGPEIGTTSKMDAARATIVTAIESGVMEQQCLLLIKSLREFGGSWSRTPVVVVRPRTGCRISTGTRSKLASMDVVIVERNLAGRHSWWGHFNKAAALAYAETQVSTPFITWLDSDVVVLSEPDRLLPEEGVDFVARPAAAVDVASDGDDQAAHYWRRVCDLAGTSFETFPSVHSYPDGKLVKAYFHGGNFSYRRAVGLGAKHRSVFESILDASVKSRSAGIYHTDQVALSVAVNSLDLSFSLLDPRLNLDLDASPAPHIPIEEAQILHYHGAFWPSEIDRFRPQLERLPRGVQDLLDGFVPWHEPPLTTRLLNRANRFRRDRTAKAMEQRAVAV